MRAVIEEINDILQCEIELHTDPDLLRPNDNDIIIGSYDKIKSLVSWEPTISMHQSLIDIINYWKKSVMMYRYLS